MSHDGGVLVAVKAVGICGTDLAARRNGTVRVTPGHEFAGTLEDGRAVTVQPNLFCGECALCADGATHLCPSSLRAFYGLSLDGGMVPSVRVAARAVRPLPDGMSFAHGALAEPLAVGVHAVARAGAPGDEPLLVVGAGSIGLCVVAAAVDAGWDVVVSARHPHQVEAATRLGARLLADEPERRRYRRVVDGAGSQSALDDAIGRTARGGAIVTLGGGATWTGALDMRALMAEIDLLPAILYTEAEFSAALDLLARRPEVGELLVSHTLPLSEIDRAFAIAGDVKAEGAIKVQMAP